MQTTSTTPDWAVELVKQVCKERRRALPSKLQWYDRSKSKKVFRTFNEDGSRSLQIRNQKYTSGTTWGSGKIHISAGTDVQDQRLVLLHELAHHLLNKTKKSRLQGHTIRFWRLAFELYHQYGVDLAYAYEREKNYKKKATVAYLELMNKLKTA